MIYQFWLTVLGYHYYILSLSEPCPGEEKHQFYIFTQKLPPLGVGVGGMKFTVLCLLTLQMVHTKFGKNCPLVLKKDMLTYDAQRTKNASNIQFHVSILTLQMLHNKFGEDMTSCSKDVKGQLIKTDANS